MGTEHSDINVGMITVYLNGKRVSSIIYVCLLLYSKQVVHSGVLQFFHWL